MPAKRRKPWLPDVIAFMEKHSHGKVELIFQEHEVVQHICSVSTRCGVIVDETLTDTK